MLDPNSSFSTKNPSLQLAWDSTSLGALKRCPRYYQLSILNSWQQSIQSIHLTFGIVYHGALERFDHARAAGRSYEDSVDDAVAWALKETWDTRLGRPWFSDSNQKNRGTLLRTIVWYLDQFSEDPLETLLLANGKPAVECSFRFESDYNTKAGEKYLLCGHLDRIATLGGQPWIVDRKTTGSTVSAAYFERYSPDNQFTLYMLTGRIFYSIPVTGLIVDAAQIAVGFSRFQRGIVQRSAETLEEWYKDLRFWLKQAEDYAQKEYWPMNDASCGMYGGCQFRGICGKSPGAREAFLHGQFQKRVWDPLQVRGDI